MEPKVLGAAPEGEIVPAGNEQSAAAGNPPPPASQAAPPAPADQTKDLRDRLAQVGRERAQAAAELQQARAEMAQLRGEFGSVVNTINEERRQAALAALPPEQRTQAEVDSLKQEIRQLKTGAATSAPPPLTPQQQVEYQQRRSQELIAQANSVYGLGEEHTISADDIPADAWASEQAFVLALKTMGGERQRLAARQTPASTSRQEDPAVAGSKKNDDTLTLTRDELMAMVRDETQKALEGTGASRPGSPKPSGNAGADPGDPDYAKLIASARTSRNGTAQLRSKLQEAREALGTGRR